MDIELYHKTLWWAAQMHQKQFFPATQMPYLVHLLQVYEEVRHALTHEPVEKPALALCCALLHDSIEDTSATAQEIEQIFGKSVADGVLALSKNPHLPKNEQMAESLERILAQGPEIALVKMCDRICNLQSPPQYWGKAKIEAYRQEALQIWEKLGHRHAFAARRLAEKIALYQQFL